MIRLPELDAFNDLTKLDFEPLTVTLQLEQNARMVSYDPLKLDGLLAFAVVQRATSGRGLQNQEGGYWIPLPLKQLWNDERGFPLWASSVFYPVADCADDVSIYHKRNSDGSMHNRKKLKTRAGPWMPRRIPYPVKVCERYEARCVGNTEAIAHFLNTDNFTHIGKKRMARVVDIIVERARFSERDVLVRDGVLIKAIPQVANLVDIQDAPSLVGWTPPHWKPGLFLPGWRVGQKKCTAKSTR